MAPFKNASLTSVIVPATMYGLATYATYALTVKAVFNVFNWTIVISDIAWGMALVLQFHYHRIYNQQSWISKLIIVLNNKFNKLISSRERWLSG